MQLHNLMCCGIKEIQGLRDWSEAKFFHLLSITHNGAFPCAWICFNGVDSGGYVETFRQFILREGLGPITNLNKVQNPNSNNVLDIGLWQVDRTAVAAWTDRKRRLYANGCPCPPCLHSHRVQAAAAELNQRYAAQILAGQHPQIAEFPAARPGGRTVGEVLRAAAADIQARQAPPEEYLDNLLAQLDNYPAPAVDAGRQID